LPEKIYTTYQIGKFCQVNIRTVIRWIETGKLKAYTTPGGHRRVKWSDLINFLTNNKMPIPSKLEGEKKKKILIVDDDPDFYKKASEILGKIQGQEIEIKNTASGFDAGILVAEWYPDLILLNFIIPDLDGFEITKRIRRKERIKNIPIIAISPTTNPIELKKIKNCGVDAVITKDIESSSFLEKVNRFLYTSSHQ